MSTYNLKIHRPGNSDENVQSVSEPLVDRLLNGRLQLGELPQELTTVTIIKPVVNDASSQMIVRVPDELLQTVIDEHYTQFG